MASVGKNTLGRFLRNLGKYKGTINENDITQVVGDIGVKVVNQEYATGILKPTNVRSVVKGSRVEIIASGEKLAFSEFGTGVRGQGSYRGNLPRESMTLRFESPKGVQQSTKGWQYNYRASQLKEKGIIIKDFTGRTADAQMYKSFQVLRLGLSDKIRQTIRKNISKG